MKRIFFAVFLIITSSSCIFAGTTLDPSAEKAVIVLDGSQVTYAGKINADNIERFLHMVAGKPVSELIIASSGGEINAGMKMGEWVFDHQVDIVIERMCMSSCANYVFTAGRKKTINKNSIVAWHGSILQANGLSDEDLRAAAIKGYELLSENDKKKIDIEELITQSIRQMRDYRATTTARQQQYFQKIGVDEFICRVGNDKYGAKDFFFLSAKDMATFGVLNVHAPTDYENTDLALFRQTGKNIDFIKLP